MAQARYYSATAQPTVLTSGITSTQTTINVVAVTGFPASVPYILALDYNTPSEEIVLVTAQAGTTLTVTRAYDGTSGTSHNSGAGVRHTWTAKDGNDSRAHEAASTGVHGLGALSSVVGTTDTQTLSNKTLINPIITGSTTLSSPTITGTVSGNAIYLNPTFKADVDANPSEIVQKRSATQTGDLTSWRNDVGTTLAFVTSAGVARLRQGFSSGSADQMTVDASGNIVTSGNITATGNLVVTGIGSTRYFSQAANQSVTSSTALVNSSIVVPVEANATYVFAGYIAYDGVFGGGGGIKVGLTGPTGWTAMVAFNGPGISGTAPVEYNSTNMTQTQTNAYGTYGTGGNQTTLNPSGFVKTSSTAGNITFQFAQSTSNATSTTIYAGSYLLLTRVA